MGFSHPFNCAWIADRPQLMCAMPQDMKHGAKGLGFALLLVGNPFF
jgi:hypothetical protein